MTFDERYRTGRPPWDIGRPQPEVVRLLDEGRVLPPLIDIGCGPGESALAAAARGIEAVGVDAAPTAIEHARAKASARGLSVRFEVADALHLETLGRTFATALDVGLFHVFDDAERVEYTKSLAGVLRPGGHAYVLCFSDAEPDWGGPRRVRGDEIPGVFEKFFEILDVQRAKFDTVRAEGAAEAWRIWLRRRPS